MRKLPTLLVSCAAAPFVVSAAQAAITMTPLSSFGGGDGWLSPGNVVAPNPITVGENPYLNNGNNERGLAFGNGHLYLASRTSVGGSGVNVRILDALTGADLGGLNTSGVSGGTFAINTLGVGGDGVIYANNLTTASAATGAGAFKVYSWANEAAAPANPYSGTGGLVGARVGDSFAVIGSGASTRIAAGYGGSPVVAGNNSYAIIDPTAGTATAIAFTGTPPNAGDFRLGITFADASHVFGTQSATARYTSFSGSTGTLVASPAIGAAERILGFAVVGGIPMLAAQSNGDSHVTVYDATDPGSLVVLATGNNTSGSLTGNGNGTGQIAWNVAPDGMSATLYAMSTNQGIQAFSIVVPEPGMTGLAALGLIAAAARRRSRIYTDSH